MSNFWERQDGETKAQYDAFAAYRDLGPARSIVKAIESTGKEPAKNRRNWQRWSAQNLWVARVEAFDAHVDEEERRELIAARREMRKRHRALSKHMQSKAYETLQSLAPGDLAPSSLANVVKVASDLERLAVGEPTELVAASEEAKPDYSRLSSEELIQLREIMLKLGADESSLQDEG